MMNASSHDSTGDSPYRTVPAPRPFDPESGLVPYDGQRHLRLTISAGLAHARIVVDPNARDLFTIDPGPGPRPRLQLREGELAVNWHTSFREWICNVLAAGNVFTSGFTFSDELTIVLHPAVEWTLAIHGGLCHLECDLSAGQVARIDIAGGASHVAFALPAPAALVPIRISGGASHLSLRRPAAAGVTLDVGGGLCNLRLDDRKFEAIGGAAQLETRNVSDAGPRYDLSISGGACDVTIERG